MPPCHSDLVRGVFAANSRDITPQHLRQLVCIRYLPFSSDARFTAWCTSVLSPPELQRAARFTASDARSLYIQRRAFRRYCAALAADHSGALSGPGFEETAKGQPFLPPLPGHCFSFSSCASGMLGAWSSHCAIGVDIEDGSRETDATALARHYFSAAEAGLVVEGVTAGASQRAFLQLWCLKEAALKSVGEGMPYGLDAFEFALEPELRIVRAPPEHGGAERFSGHLLENPGVLTAIILHHRGHR